MHTQTKNISDQDIFAMIAENNQEGWGRLYDKYAPAMYGIICKLTGNRNLSDEIFEASFLALTKKQNFCADGHSLCVFLLKYTHCFAREQLKERGITAVKIHVPETKFINILCSQHITLKELSSDFKITEEEVKQRLHTEFLEIRNQKNFEGVTLQSRTLT